MRILDITNQFQLQLKINYSIILIRNLTNTIETYRIRNIHFL